MALVDYSSSSSSVSGESDADGSHSPPAKRRRRGAQNDDEDSASSAVVSNPKASRKQGHGTVDKAPVSSSSSSTSMPPLPSAFHDLYASTVRQSVVDDPSLHQGRKRQTPHIPGNWPSHVYIEWYPDETQHDMLDELLCLVEKELGDDMKLHKFLTSDLGAHLPLHISLSRPLSLRTADKDAFFESLTQGIRRSCVGAFAVRPAGLAWYRSPDSDRTFLILRVVAAPGSRNPQLMRLLRRCNATAAAFKQPALYQRKDTEAVDEAFHLSIAWTFGLPDDETALRVLALFKKHPFKAMRTWDIGISGVKVKIGNAVSHVPLTDLGTQAATLSGSLLFDN